MASRSLRYDDTNMREAHVGGYGVKDSEWRDMLPRLRAAKKAVQKLSRKNEQGFLRLPSERTLHEETLSAASRIRKSCTDMVVLGIGGSDLGARALDQALSESAAKNRRSLKLHFAGSSTDPDELTELLASLNLKKTCVNVISKSGGTLETMSAFLVFRELLKKRLGKRTFRRRIIATTDPESGALYELAKKEKYDMLPIPMNVGGRFSVLSPVGMLPAAVAGMDTNALLGSARLFVDRFHELTVNECSCMRYAGLHFIGMEKRKQNIHILMPYAKKLEQFARWVRQLIAESLGKEQNRSGKTVHAGPTPVASVGPEDQHSQLQLYSEGPFDKLITFINVKNFLHDLRTPVVKDLDRKIGRFGNRSFETLIHIEQKATAEALKRQKRPNGTIEITRLDERAMGELFMFFELAVAVMGELMDVNAYNQPGVELSKELMRNALR
jgi:glucose-6-phosphate isomerase